MFYVVDMCISQSFNSQNLCFDIFYTIIGVMPDGTVRFKDSEGKDIFHFMGYVYVATIIQHDSFTPFIRPTWTL